MKRAILVLVVLSGVAAISVCAAEPVASLPEGPQGKADAKPAERTPEKASPDLPEPVIPKRELKFEVSEDEYPIPFTVADPKLLEQRYIALFCLDGPRGPRVHGYMDLFSEGGPGYPGGMPGRPRYPGSMPGGEYYSGRPDGLGTSAADPTDRKEPRLPPLALYEMAFRKQPLPPELFQRLLPNIPEDRRPAEEVVSALTARVEPYVKCRTWKVVKDRDTQKTHNWSKPCDLTKPSK